jgi:ubiquinone/menaquinone biosynthesis C-methylase UbiE
LQRSVTDKRRSLATRPNESIKGSLNEIAGALPTDRLSASGTVRCGTLRIAGLADSQSSEVHHPVFARLFSAGGGFMDAIESQNRRELNKGLAGRVIEVGCGAGPNFAYYPDSVTEVLAVEPEAHFREEAEKAARDAPVPVRIVPGVGERLPAKDGEFDAAVTSHVLCTIPDAAAALREVWRVVRPGGELRFYEHVAASSNSGRRIQHALDATIWPRLAGGCHCGRDTEDEIIASGFKIERSRRLQVTAWGIPHHLAPHILGVAIRP